jgi:hypothetical protein
VEAWLFFQSFTFTEERKINHVTLALSCCSSLPHVTLFLTSAPFLPSIYSHLSFNRLRNINSVMLRNKFGNLRLDRIQVTSKGRRCVHIPSCFSSRKNKIQLMFLFCIFSYFLHQYLFFYIPILWNETNNLSPQVIGNDKEMFGLIKFYYSSLNYFNVQLLSLLKNKLIFQC